MFDYEGTPTWLELSVMLVLIFLLLIAHLYAPDKGLKTAPQCSYLYKTGVFCWARFQE